MICTPGGVRLSFNCSLHAATIKPVVGSCFESDINLSLPHSLSYTGDNVSRSVPPCVFRAFSLLNPRAWKQHGHKDRVALLVLAMQYQQVQASTLGCFLILIALMCHVLYSRWSNLLKHGRLLFLMQLALHGNFTQFSVCLPVPS